MNDASLDLRARRRLDTRQEIHRVALELFEAQGVRETTVQQIAERAGVSSRTFFRHFAAKEQAGLPGHHRLLRVIEELDLSGADLPSALRAVESAAEGVMDRRNDPELAEHRRVALLLAREPELRALAASQERELVARLRARLSEGLEDCEPTAALLAAEVAVAVWRACWERWGELAVAGHEADPAELYRDCREELHRVVGRP
ncbi:helix-turn-helix domain-containing protein [Nocardiopsis dassonvillei]|uniref:TetR/AcrR family transcriptional regulator n=1 Tax=Nocardiopsis dassonvillei TaxID=2014 RepID=UPI00200CCB3D|nr:TetR/AcrR family transcriptional regulator [Nocardiopsis dassonvillei]MCK9872317.1 TetR/AcrR family transcriptional regulator [Nocardiopsis dassonvillei]